MKWGYYLFGFIFLWFATYINFISDVHCMQNPFIKRIWQQIAYAVGMVCCVALGFGYFALGASS